MRSRTAAMQIRRSDNVRCSRLWGAPRWSMHQIRGSSFRARSLAGPTDRATGTPRDVSRTSSENTMRRTQTTTRMYLPYTLESFAATRRAFRHGLLMGAGADGGSRGVGSVGRRETRCGFHRVERNRIESRARGWRWILGFLPGAERRVRSLLARNAEVRIAVSTGCLVFTSEASAG